MSDFDVVVVGAGPAGSTAARELAAQSARVLLIDRAAFPRDEAFEEDFRACESHDRLSLSRVRGALPLLLVGEGTKTPRRTRLTYSDAEGEADYRSRARECVLGAPPRCLYSWAKGDLAHHRVVLFPQLVAVILAERATVPRLGIALIRSLLNPMLTGPGRSSAARLPVLLRLHPPHPRLDQLLRGLHIVQEKAPVREDRLARHELGLVAGQE